MDLLQNLHLAFFYSNVSHQIYQCSLIKIQDTFVASLEKQRQQNATGEEAGAVCADKACSFAESDVLCD